MNKTHFIFTKSNTPLPSFNMNQSNKVLDNKKTNPFHITKNVFYSDFPSQKNKEQAFINPTRLRFNQVDWNSLIEKKNKVKKEKNIFRLSNFENKKKNREGLKSKGLIIQKINSGGCFKIEDYYISKDSNSSISHSYLEKEKEKKEETEKEKEKEKENTISHVNLTKTNENNDIRIENPDFKSSSTQQETKNDNNLNENQAFPSNSSKFNIKNIKNTNIDDIFKRIMNNNQKEAEARSTSRIMNSSSYQNKVYKQRSTSNKFFSSTNSGFIYEKPYNKEQSYMPLINTRDSKGSIILSLDKNDLYHWKKHEDIWKNLSFLSSQSSFSLKSLIKNETHLKFLLPANDSDILLSLYIYTYIDNTDNNSYIINEDKVEIDADSVNYLNEVKKWKGVYKKLLIRWHPDKLIPFLKRINIDEEMIMKIEKRTFSIMNGVNSLFRIVLERLKIGIK